MLLTREVDESTRWEVCEKRQRHLSVSLLFLDSSADEPRLKYIYSMSPSGKNSLGERWGVPLNQFVVVA